MPNIRGIMVFVAMLGFAGPACDFHEKKSLASEARAMPRFGHEDRSEDRADWTQGEVFDPHRFDFGSGLECVSISSSGSHACQDAGGYPSTCATARCPFDHMLTGGGGACAAGDRRIKSLFPRLDQGEFTIACEEQGVDPQAIAICCRL